MTGWVVGDCKNKTSSAYICLSGDWAELGNIVKCESTDNNKYDDADSTTVPMVNYLLFCYCVNEFQALSCPTQ